MLIPVTTPKAITPSILKFCERFEGATKNPIFIPVEPQKDAPLNSCFHVVPKVVELHGGELIHGWTIWEWPGLYLDAEFHAVWQLPDGTLVDPNPKADGESQILFLVDSAHKFEGQRRPNRSMPLVDNPVVRKWIGHSKKMNDLMPRAGELAALGPTFMDHALVAMQLLSQMNALHSRLNSKESLSKARSSITTLA